MTVGQDQDFENALDHLMTAKEGDVLPIQDKVVATIEHLGRLIDYPPSGGVDLEGIGEQSDSEAEPGDIIIGSDGEDGGLEPDAEDPVAQTDEPAVADGQIYDAEGRYLPHIEEMIAKAQVGRRSHRARQTEQARWENLFDSGFIWKKMNERRGLADLQRLLGVPRRTLYDWRTQLRRNRRWRPWMPDVPYGERNRKITQEMAELVLKRTREEFINKRRVVTAPRLRPLFRACWEVTHGPEEPRPGLHDNMMRNFLAQNRMAWRRTHTRRRLEVPIGVMQDFSVRMM
jgi:hypothetical protein